MRQIQILLEQIDWATEPSRMSKSQALELLEQLVADIDSRIEALKEEIRNEGEA